MIAVVQDIPFSYALTVGALALTVSFRVLTVTGPIRYGAMIAFFAATLPLHFASMPMAFWALLAGIAGLGSSNQNNCCGAGGRSKRLHTVTPRLVFR